MQKRATVKNKDLQQTEYYVEDQLHNDNDLPAIVCNDGSKHWFAHGKKHRGNDKPAFVGANGVQQWYKNNMIHRENDLPACIMPSGTKYYHFEGRTHRDNYKPAIEFANGDKTFVYFGKVYGKIKYSINDKTGIQEAFYFILDQLHSNLSEQDFYILLKAKFPLN